MNKVEAKRLLPLLKTIPENIDNEQLRKDRLYFIELCQEKVGDDAITGRFERVRDAISRAYFSATGNEYVFTGSDVTALQKLLRQAGSEAVLQKVRWFWTDRVIGYLWKDGAPDVGLFVRMFNRIVAPKGLAQQKVPTPQRGPSWTPPKESAFPKDWWQRNAKKAYPEF